MSDWYFFIKIINGFIKTINFSFPKDKEMKKQWILATKRQYFVVTSGSKLCGKHFRPEDYAECCGLGERKRLKKCAVPSIFDFPKHLLTKPQASRSRRRQTNTILPPSTPTPSTSLYFFLLVGIYTYLITFGIFILGIELNLRH